MIKSESGGLVRGNFPQWGAHPMTLGKVGHKGEAEAQILSPTFTRYSTGGAPPEPRNIKAKEKTKTRDTEDQADFGETGRGQNSRERYREVQSRKQISSTFENMMDRSRTVYREEKQRERSRVEKKVKREQNVKRKRESSVQMGLERFGVQRKVEN